jgi:predicted enzyme related to lactoylglutathione lyase
VSGQVVHFEIPADDLDRARDFYREAFGWDMTVVAEMDYTLVMTTPSGEDGRPTQVGAINGGMLRRQEPVTSTMITLNVDNVDTALATVERLGGKTTTGRHAVGDMGFSAYFEDTEGNVVGLWEPARPS